MQQEVFYLHEDDWAMIDLLPSENYTEILRVARTAQTFGEEHFDGTGWTDMYVIPQPTYPFSLRTLPLHDLQNILSACFQPASIVQSGYSSYRETLPNCFAFIGTKRTDGAFYGNHKEGLVTQLHLLPCYEENPDRTNCFIELLHSLGTQYNLVLADWWNHNIIDLRNKTRVIQYVKDSSDEE